MLLKVAIISKLDIGHVVLTDDAFVGASSFGVEEYTIKGNLIMVTGGSQVAH